MPSIKVLDSWALIAYFENEGGGVKVNGILKEAVQAKKNLLISVVNWGEVLHVIERRYGREKKNEIEHLMDQMHLEVVAANKEIARQAAHLKATEKLPYGDAFAAALALGRKAELITGDKDFRLIEKKIRINLIV